MMAAFYAEEGLPYDAAAKRAVAARLLAEPAWGGAWFLLDGGIPAGYLALTLCFSIEFGGPIAFIDELYVLPAHRSRGLGRGALELAAGLARERGAVRLALEVAPHNPRARALYERAGFAARPYQMMTRPLD